MIRLGLKECGTWHSFSILMRWVVDSVFLLLPNDFLSSLSGLLSPIPNLSSSILFDCILLFICFLHFSHFCELFLSLSLLSFSYFPDSLLFLVILLIVSSSLPLESDRTLYWWQLKNLGSLTRWNLWDEGYLLGTLITSDYLYRESLSEYNTSEN
jgi:hypothetical protein